MSLLAVELGYSTPNVDEKTSTKVSGRITRRLRDRQVSSGTKRAGHSVFQQGHQGNVRGKCTLPTNTHQTTNPPKTRCECQIFNSCMIANVAGGKTVEADTPLAARPERRGLLLLFQAACARMRSASVGHGLRSRSRASDSMHVALCSCCREKNVCERRSVDTLTCSKHQHVGRVQ